MDNSIVPANGSNSTIVKCSSTGLEIHKSYKADSGFVYKVGVRSNIDGLIIIEQVAEGTGVTYLNNILIFEKDTEELITQVNLDSGVRYSRQVAMSYVQQALVNTLIEASDSSIGEKDLININNRVNKILDDAYFKQSRVAILNWAKLVEII